jgi:hypothetical protein
MDIESLQSEERRLLRKFDARAARLVRADPSLTPSIARARACEQMPNCMHKYLETRAVLTQMGVRGLTFDEV